MSPQRHPHVVLREPDLGEVQRSARVACVDGHRHTGERRGGQLGEGEREQHADPARQAAAHGGRGVAERHRPRRDRRRTCSLDRW
jgi:hypothetical protein